MIPERNSSTTLMEGMVRDPYKLTVSKFPKAIVI
jgi:hypothetical protein